MDDAYCNVEIIMYLNALIAFKANELGQSIIYTSS
jgi:hypothetical protein